MPTSIKIEQRLLSNLLQVQGEFNQDMETVREVIRNKYEAVQVENTKIIPAKKLAQILRDNWMLTKIDEKGTQTYINNLSISEITIFITFMQDLDETDNDFAQWMNNAAIGFVGAILTNIEDAPIELGAFRSKSQSCPMSLAVNLAKTQYYADFTKSLIPILGSLNVIGNPQLLFREIGQGAQGFSSKATRPGDRNPNQPIGLALDISGNIYKGTTSLVKHTISGTMGSINRITKSFADTFSSIHMDKRMNRERLKMRFSGDKGFLGGLKRGLMMTGLGLKEAIAGLVRLPIEGVKAEGAWGGVKGTLKGVIGVIAKPVAGILDGVSGIAGGIGQGIKGEGEDGRFGGPNWRRVREPRAFYGENGALREFKDSDAKIQAALSIGYDQHNLNGISGVVEAYVKTYDNPKLLAFSNSFITLIDARTNVIDFYISQNSFRGFKTWSDISEQERLNLKNIIFDESCTPAPVRTNNIKQDVYLDFKKGRDQKTKLSQYYTNKEGLQFSNTVVDEEGYPLADVQYRTNKEENDQLESLMIFRVDQESDKKLLKYGHHSNFNIAELRGVKEFRVSAYNKEDVNTFKNFVMKHYPNVWY